jgi:hypothetical protein
MSIIEKILKTSKKRQNRFFEKKQQKTFTSCGLGRREWRS